MSDSELKIETKKAHRAFCPGEPCGCPRAWKWEGDWYVDIIADNGDEESILLDDYLDITRRAQ